MRSVAERPATSTVARDLGVRGVANATEAPEEQEESEDIGAGVVDGVANATPADIPVSDPAWFKAELRALRAEQARQATVLDAILHALERGRTVRPEHVALLVAIAEAIGDRSFTGAQLFEHAAVAPGLQDALQQADVMSPRELGWLLRRMEASALPGLRLERVGDTRHGVAWRVRVSLA